MRSPDDDPEPDLRLAAVPLRRCSADRRSRPDCWRWPNRKVFAFLAGCVRRDKNLAGCSRFHRADRGMARRPARSGCCATSHTSGKQSLRPRFSVRRVRLHLRARSLPGSRLTRCGRGVTCRFATDARENAVAAAAERHRDRQVAAAIRPQWRASLICFTTARACPC